MTDPSALQELARLDAGVTAAAERRQRARERRRRAPEVSVEATKALSEYRDDVDFRRKDYDVEEHRKLTQELSAKIAADGLVLAYAGNGTLQVHDPSLAEEFEDANQALVDATAQHDEFARERAEDLDAERRHADMERVREALSGDDPAALKEALA